MIFICWIKMKFFEGKKNNYLKQNYIGLFWMNIYLITMENASSESWDDDEQNDVFEFEIDEILEETQRSCFLDLSVELDNEKKRLYNNFWFIDAKNI